ncbi:MAG: hypothetical protein ACR2N6_04655 [Miltoncostaeaceae bacterium]
MPDPEPPEPEVADSGSPEHQRFDEPPPPARIPAPAPVPPPRFGLARSWQALTPAGQWVVALAWVAVFAAAVVGIGLALSDDDEGEAMASTEMTQTTPAAPPESPVIVEDPVIVEPPPVTEEVPPPVTEEVPPVTEEAPPLEDEGSLPAPVGDPIFESSGQGPMELGEIEVGEDSSIFWTNAGGDFRVQTEQDGVATIVVNSIDAEGQSPLAAGVYSVSVVSGGSWSLQIIPS